MDGQIKHPTSKFNLCLSKYSFLSHHCPLSGRWLYGKAVSGRDCTTKKELLESMDRSTGHCVITEKMLKTVLTQSHTMTPFDTPGKQDF